jgi:hypothetical protein
LIGSQISREVRAGLSVLCASISGGHGVICQRSTVFLRSPPAFHRSDALLSAAMNIACLSTTVGPFTLTAVI